MEARLKEDILMEAARYFYCPHFRVSKNIGYLSLLLCMIASFICTLDKADMDIRSLSLMNWQMVRWWINGNQCHLIL